jgi:uncharacterized protein with PhoU and TrkA domain
MKDTSELMWIWDTPRSSVRTTEDLAMEVIRLEEKIGRLRLSRPDWRRCWPLGPSRTAEALSGVLQIASAGGDHLKRAGDIASIVTLKMGIPHELKKDLRQADETVARGVVGADSKVSGRSLEGISFETEAGMSVIAIRRGESWIYDPEPGTVIVAGDSLFARGHDEGVALFVEMATASHRQSLPGVRNRSVDRGRHHVEIRNVRTWRGPRLPTAVSSTAKRWRSRWRCEEEMDV